MARAKTKLSQEPPRQSALASRITEKWGGPGDDVELDRLASELGDVQRYDLVAALKELEKAGAGEFVVARAGRKARFVWAAKKPRGAAQVSPSPAPKAASQAAKSMSPMLKTPSPTAKPATTTPTMTSPVPRTGTARRAPVQRPPLPAPREGMVSKAVQLASASKQRLAAASKALGVKTPDASLEHVFHLRPGYLATIRLPSDVTGEEVDRFCQFLRAIPFRAER